MKYLVLICSFLISYSIVAQDYPKSIPDFEIFTINGESFTNNQVKKEIYTFFVYFNPECSHCRTAFKKLELKAKQIKETDVLIYAVSANTEEKTKSFFKEYSPNLVALKNIKILRDDDFKFADTFFVGGYPTSYLYDKNQNLVSVFDGAGEITDFLDKIK